MKLVCILSDTATLAKLTIACDQREHHAKRYTDGTYRGGMNLWLAVYPVDTRHEVTPPSVAARQAGQAFWF